MNSYCHASCAKVNDEVCLVCKFESNGTVVLFQSCWHNCKLIEQVCFCYELLCSYSCSMPKCCDVPSYINMQSWWSVIGIGHIGSIGQWLAICSPVRPINVTFCYAAKTALLPDPNASCHSRSPAFTPCIVSMYDHAYLQTLFGIFSAFGIVPLALLLIPAGQNQHAPWAWVSDRSSRHQGPHEGKSSRYFTLY